MRSIKRIFNVLDRVIILRESIMFIPSILLSISSYQSNNVLLFFGLLFMGLSILISLNRFMSFNKKRKDIESLKSFIIDNTQKYKESEYYILNPKNYPDYVSRGNAPKPINQIFIRNDNLNEISVEKEKEYFTMKFLSLHENLKFKEVKNYITKVYNELGRDIQ